MPEVPTRQLRLLALTVGSLWAAVSLALLGLLCVGIARAATRPTSASLVLVASAIAGRLLLNVAVEQFGLERQRRDVRRLRAMLPSLLRRDNHLANSGRGDVLWAIDRLGERDSFEMLRGAMGTSVLALPLIFIGGGFDSLAIVLALLGLSIPFYIAAGKTAARAEETYRTQRDALSQRQLELLRHASELRALGAVHVGARDIAALSEREHQSALQAIRRALRSSLVTEFLGGVSVGLVAMVVGFGLLQGRERLAHALLAVFATAEFVGWVRRYGLAFHRREAFATATTLLRDTTTDSVPTANDELLRSSLLVTRAHPNPVSFKVCAGDHVAIIGPSGAGKTTLVETLLGWTTPVSGQVQRADSPIAHVGIDSALLRGTVRENLTLEQPVTDNALRSCLRDVQLDLDLDLELSPDGAGLSTGERVRLICARAMLHDSPLLILDDVGGVLDAKSRDALRQSIAARPSMATIEVAPDLDLITTPTLTVHLT